MHEELLQRVQKGELCEENIPKVPTIQNWISGFSRRWKEAMALRSMNEEWRFSCNKLNIILFETF